MIDIVKGDTISLAIELFSDGEPFIPESGQSVWFSIGTGKTIPFVKKEVIENVVTITYADVQEIPAGAYNYDVRVYNASKVLVATPCYGIIRFMEVPNYEL